ncbi:MAG: NAD(P)H-binding protein [Acidimicrobiia bacterium]|nr:NAD(P)H-binding protein [Acidimicrobiia bacterium]
MPVLVVGADTAVGRAAVAALTPTASQLRAFVTDPSVIDELRGHGATVAVGDVSDASHLAGAALGAFSAILIEDAAVDGRERAFATDAQEVHDAWAEAMRDAGIRRVIWVGGTPPEAIASLDVEMAAVDPAVGVDATISAIQSLDDAAELE